MTKRSRGRRRGGHPLKYGRLRGGAEPPTEAGVYPHQPKPPPQAGHIGGNGRRDDEPAELADRHFLGRRRRPTSASADARPARAAPATRPPRSAAGRSMPTGRRPRPRSPRRRVARAATRLRDLLQDHRRLVRDRRVVDVRPDAVELADRLAPAHERAVRLRRARRRARPPRAPPAPAPRATRDPARRGARRSPAGSRAPRRASRPRGHRSPSSPAVLLVSSHCLLPLLLPLRAIARLVVPVLDANTCLVLSQSATSGTQAMTVPRPPVFIGIRASRAVARHRRTLGTPWRPRSNQRSASSSRRRPSGPSATAISASCCRFTSPRSASARPASGWPVTLTLAASARAHAPDPAARRAPRRPRRAGRRWRRSSWRPACFSRRRARRPWSSWQPCSATWQSAPARPGRSCRSSRCWSRGRPPARDLTLRMSLYNLVGYVAAGLGALTVAALPRGPHASARADGGYALLFWLFALSGVRPGPPLRAAPGRPRAAARGRRPALPVAPPHLPHRRAVRARLVRRRLRPPEPPGLLALRPLRAHAGRHRRGVLRGPAAHGVLRPARGPGRRAGSGS